MNKASALEAWASHLLQKSKERSDPAIIAATKRTRTYRTSTRSKPAKIQMMPTLILICGLPGSGKTTLAKRLEAEQNAVRQCPDERIAQILNDPSSKISQDDLRTPVEQQMTTDAQDLLKQGKDVILEYGFWSKEERVAMINLAKSCNANAHLYLLNPELNEICRRVAKRNQELPPGTFMVSMKQLHEYDKMFARPVPDELALYDHFHISE